MKLIEYKNDFIKFFMCSAAVLISLFTITTILNVDKEEEIPDIVTSTIKDSNEEYTLNVDYPRFNDDKINKIITNYIYKYVKDFKLNDGLRALDISYDIYYKDNYINIVFNIENTLSNIKNHNIIINLDTVKTTYISNLYDKDHLQNEINSLIHLKYSSDIYELVKNSNINNFTYILDDEYIDVFINNINFTSIKDKPSVRISLTTDVFTFNEQYYDETKKFIAFTFDDGPSEYTLDILKTLELNNSSATFFMLGSKMNSKKEIVDTVSNSNSEVGSHTYSHKYLTKLKEKDILSEINSTNIVYNEITGGNIELIRPPYGSYNELVKTLSPCPLVTWNIDPKDWLLRDADAVYNNILKYVSDGSIVLMHDVYPETVEAVKKLLPVLKEMGYEVVSVSNLAKQKEVQLNAGSIIKSIK